MRSQIWLSALQVKATRLNAAQTNGLLYQHVKEPQCSCSQPKQSNISFKRDGPAYESGHSRRMNIIELPVVTCIIDHQIIKLLIVQPNAREHSGTVRLRCQIHDLREQASDSFIVLVVLRFGLPLCLAASSYIATHAHSCQGQVFPSLLGIEDKRRT